MRTPDEMINLILDFARRDDAVRMVGMEGSRTNPNIARDSFQDFDITYFVTDPGLFTGNDAWLSFFGNIIMMQKPEDMELFPAQEPGYSYLILFDDYNKMDLTLLPETALEDYLAQDRLRTILLDKNETGYTGLIPTDEDYWIRKPSARSFDDCCNEFWNLTPYVVKGLCREEILFAADHLQLMRSELLRMLSWQTGAAYGFHFSVGKNYKFIDKYLPPATWESLLKTYRCDSYNALWDAMFLCHQLFRTCSLTLAKHFQYPYPPYDENVSRYAEHFYGIWRDGEIRKIR